MKIEDYSNSDDSFRKNGILLIISGLLLLIYYLFDHLAIHYFTEIGFAEKLSSIGFSLMLVVGGILMIKRNSYSTTIIQAFILGRIIDRLLVLSLYYDKCVLRIFLPPILGVILASTIYFLTKDHFARDHSKVYYSQISVLVFIILFLPKLIY